MYEGALLQHEHTLALIGGVLGEVRQSTPLYLPHISRWDAEA